MRVTPENQHCQTREVMDKVIHGLILAVFGIACWCLWAILTVMDHTAQHAFNGAALPAFTRFCLELRPLLWVLPLLAAAYCLFVWIRKADGQKSWVGFFASTMSALVLLTYPVMIAAWLPLIDILVRLAHGSQ